MEPYFNWLTPYSEILQLLSFVATIALTIISVFGLKQLSIAKKSLKIQSIRDSKKFTSDYIYKYLDRILDNQVLNQTQKNEKILSDFVFSESNEYFVDFSSINKKRTVGKIKTREEKLAYIEQVLSAASIYNRFLNELEAFCSVVSSGVVDEEMLHRAIGQSFLDLINEAELDQYLRFCAVSKNIMTNVEEIYILWSMRVTIKELEEVEKENNNTRLKINKMKIKLAAVKKKSIESIGVK